MNGSLLAPEPPFWPPVPEPFCATTDETAEPDVTDDREDSVDVELDDVVEDDDAGAIEQLHDDDDDEEEAELLLLLLLLFGLW